MWKRFIFTTLFFLIIVCALPGQTSLDVDAATDTNEKGEDPGEYLPLAKGDGSGSGLHGIYRTIGRILGFLGFTLLVVSIFTGGFFKKATKKINKALRGSRKRIRWHCTISYLILLISLIHAALLMYGHYSYAMWNGIFLIGVPEEAPGVNWGTISLVIMICISLGGIFQKSISRKIGKKKWKRLHGWLSIIAVVLTVLHLVMIGTTIGAPIRSLFQ
jgi:cytochrome b561